MWIATIEFGEDTGDDGLTEHCEAEYDTEGSGEQAFRDECGYH